VSKIAVVGGAGYVGMTYAGAFAELGHESVGVDIDPTKVAMLNRGEPSIYEPGMADLLRRGLDAGRLRFTTDYATALPEADFAFICVGTPSTPSGGADLTAIAAAARAIARHGSGHTVIVNKSTMPVGSAQFVENIVAEHASNGSTFAVVSNPEFLREGSAVRDVFQPSRIVLGSTDDDAINRVAALYGPLGSPVLITDSRSAEMVKYASNAFLATKISFINEMAMICEQLDADVSVVANGMGLDDRIGAQFLRPGVGFGGSCFPKDVRALAAMAVEAGSHSLMLEAVLDINASMRSRVVEKLASHLGSIAGKTIALLGLAFKPDSDDIREAPALDVARALLDAGASVRATDPAAMHHVAAALPDVVLAPDAYAAAMGSDAVILMTEWSVYQSLDFERIANSMRGRTVIDGRNALEPADVVAAELVYEGFGRAASPRSPLPRRATLVANPAATAFGARYSVEAAALAETEQPVVD
jgi:UDPglucose 6-dehydrogenase